MGLSGLRGLSGLAAICKGLNIPETIPDLNLWLDAADAGTVVLNAGKVSTWFDKSGRGNYFEQTSSELQPNYALASINGKNSILFNGVTDFLEGSTAAKSILSGLVESTGFVVVKYNNDTTGNNFALFATTPVSTSTSIWSVYHTAGSLKHGRRRISTDGGNNSTQTSAVGVAYQTASVFKPATPLHTAFRNGIQSTSSGSGLTAGTGAIGNSLVFNLGAGYLSNYMNGYICEVLHYSRALTTTERQVVEAYLRTKWGTA